MKKLKGFLGVFLIFFLGTVFGALLASGPLVDDALHAEALGLLRESTAMKRARETVRSYAEEARARLAPLPQGSPRQAMESLCDFIADRTS